MNRKKIFITINLLIFIFLLSLITTLFFLFEIKQFDFYTFYNISEKNIFPNISLPPGWDWITILIISASCLVGLLFIHILVVFIIKIRNAKKGLFHEEEHYDYNENYYNEESENYSYDVNMSGYVLEYSYFQNNIGNRQNYFVTYKNKLRDDYLPNNWWIY